MNDDVNPKELWQELNSLRKNPPAFFSLISDRKQYYNKQGLLFSLFHPNRSIKTQEGREPLKELQDELVDMPSLNPIAYNSDLNITASDLARQFRSCHGTNADFSVNPKELRAILNRS